MPTKYKDYPIYTYNEPATYSDFTGGINTDPSNEHLLKNEMRDCVNMTYLSGALVKRKGAKELCKIQCDEDIKNIQGVFLFTYRITYIIVAADGKLYQSVFNENTTLHLTRLNIYKTETYSDKAFNEEAVFDGLPIYQKSDVIPEKHEGYIQEYIKNLNTEEELQLNKRDSWESVTSGMVNRGDYFEELDGLYKVKYICIKDFEKTIVLPTNTEYWEEETNLQGDLSGSYYVWNEYRTEPYPYNYTVEYTDSNNVTHYYRCIKHHSNMKNALGDSSYFLKTSVYNFNYSFFDLMYFQNYRKIEAATFENNLYIMTGTRIVQVNVQDNKLVATIVMPHICNNSEIINIGYNYMSPYPELAIGSQTDTVTTSIGRLLVRKTSFNKYILEPIMNIQIGDSIDNYWFRWEKYVNNAWHVIVPFRIQDKNYQGSIGLSSADSYKSIKVPDADTTLYRVTFAKSFETPNIIVPEWENCTEDYVFERNTFIRYKDVIYRCMSKHLKNSEYYPGESFEELLFRQATSQKNTEVVLWETYLEYERLNYAYITLTEDANHNEIQTEQYGYVLDYKVDKLDGEYFGQATSILWKDLSISDNFTLIQSCTKVLVDGNKLLYYGDNYNSGMWFKTILNNPGYVTDRGNLSFKTTKNEALIKAVAFQGNIICFANSDNIGGSIHIVTGNGDDYDASDGYYSPYQRRTINATVSSDNADTIQVCDNILIFKYFKKLYYINASDLSNDIIKVNQCNTRILSSNNSVEIPWDDNSCVSEVTNDYYALIWKEKFSIDNSNYLIQERPGIRVKMYFNMQNQLEDNSISFPWLRDESKFFNTSAIFYYKGRSVMLYNNILISFNEDTYEDLGEIVPCEIKLKAEELNYDKIYKLISSILVYYHRTQHSKIDFNIITRNEAGHIIYNSKNKLFSANDLAIFKEGALVSEDKIRVDSTIQDTKLFNVINKFPCLLAETTITAENKGRFSLSSITYNYETIDAPESNPYDTYTNIIRPEEI